MNQAVALLVPPGLPATAGNLVSARRLATWLGRVGVRAEILEAGRRLAVPLGCGVIHALHALQAGEPARVLARRAGLPLMVTLTGTDLNQGDTPALWQVVSHAAAVITYHPEARDIFIRRLPDLSTPVEVIPPGVDTLVPGPRQRSLWGWGPGEVVFLLASGLRQVKNPGFAVGLLADVRAKGLPLRLAVAGPVREDSAAQALQQAISHLPWASYLGEVPHERMGQLYRAADVILNTSRSEGLSNAVLEAMAAGRPVLAADIAGNRAALRHLQDGILYRDRADFIRWAELLATSPWVRARLGTAARRAAAARFSPLAEAQAYQNLYRRLGGPQESSNQSTYLDGTARSSPPG